jgi:hypothetical protein
MGKKKGHAGADTPPRRQLPLDANIDQVIEVIDLVPVRFPLLLLNGTDKMPERLLVPVAQRDRPQLGIGMFLDPTGGSGEHAKPGRASSRGDSTLAGGRPCKTDKK